MFQSIKKLTYDLWVITEDHFGISKGELLNISKLE